MRNKQKDDLLDFEGGKKVAQQKKSYVKPRLETVMLFADEVLGVCKLQIVDGCNIQSDPKSG